jgi:hypothetical protein
MRADIYNGHRYAGRIELEGFDRFASRGMLRDKLQGAGFSNVQIYENSDVPPSVPAPLRVEGSGVRYATGTWTGPDVALELPEQVKDFADITSGGAPQAPLPPASSGPAPGPLGGGGQRALPLRLNVATLPPALERDFIFVALAIRLGMEIL